MQLKKLRYYHVKDLSKDFAVPKLEGVGGLKRRNLFASSPIRVDLEIAYRVPDFVVSEMHLKSMAEVMLKEMSIAGQVNFETIDEEIW